MKRTLLWKITKCKALFFIPIACMTIGCQNKTEYESKDPDPVSLRKPLKIAMPLAFAAKCAFATMKGHKPDNVTILKSNDPASGYHLMAIAVDAGFPLPQGIEASGSIKVAGYMAMDNLIIMSIIFTEMTVAKGMFAINDISTIPVVLEQDSVTGEKELWVIYADQDINAGSDTLLTTRISKNQSDVTEVGRYQTMRLLDESIMVAQNAWIIKVDNNESPANAADDSCIIFGGGQYVDASSPSADLTQLSMMYVVMKPTCGMNPLDGYISLRCLAAGNRSEIGLLILSGQSACDGTLLVLTVAGVYVRLWGKPLELGLDK